MYNMSKQFGFIILRHVNNELIPLDKVFYAKRNN